MIQVDFFADDLFRRCCLARLQKISPADFHRRNAHDLGDAVHVPLHGEKTLRRPKSAKSSVRWSICRYCFRSNAHTGPVIRTAGMNGAARKHDRRQRCVSAAIDGELDFTSKNFSILAYGATNAPPRRMPVPTSDPIT